VQDGNQQFLTDANGAFQGSANYVAMFQDGSILFAPQDQPETVHYMTFDEDYSNAVSTFWADRGTDSDGNDVLISVMNKIFVTHWAGNNVFIQGRRNSFFLFSA